MSINQPPVNALNSRSAGLETRSGSGKDRSPSLPRLTLAPGEIQTAVGISGMVALAAGGAFAFACTAWAIQAGVPAPLAIMSGFCTVAASACLFAAFLLVRNAGAKALPVSSSQRQPSYAAWKLVSKLSVSDAAHLWCGLEPGSRATEECIAWASAMLDAIRRGELAICERPRLTQPAIDQERNSPTWQTEIARDALKTWAASHGHLPRFLDK